MFVLPLRAASQLWPGIAACFAVMLGLFVWQSRHTNADLTAELLDQHLATLSVSSAPQVVSSDRHTVKPWFQGKLPFSFNLPEPVDLPPDTVLQRADLAYLSGHPAALLLFTLMIQLLLGFAAFLTRVAWVGTQANNPMVISTVAHTSVGALLLAIASVLTIQVWRHAAVTRTQEVPEGRTIPA